MEKQKNNYGKYPLHLGILAMLAAIFLSNFSLNAQALLDQQVKLLVKGSVPLLSPEAADSIIQECQVLDSREREEFSVSHLQNAKWVGYDDFDMERIQDLDKDRPVLIYCSIGYRSEKIGEKLLQAGFKEVYNLRGGIFKWKNEGLPLINMQGKSTDSIHTYNAYWGMFIKEGKKTH